MQARTAGTRSRRRARTVRRLGAALAAAATLGGLDAAPALAVPDCAGNQPARTVLDGQGVLESVIADPRGRLFYTDTSRKALMRLDGAGDAPRELAAGIESPGGLVLEPGGAVIVGQGDGFLQGAAGNAIGLASLLAIDPDSGARETLATGLAMANGLARTADGTIYASDDAGLHIDRVVDGRVEPRWARVASGNGLAVDPTGRHLYAAQTFVPAAIQRVELADPANVQRYAAPGPTDIAAGLDGMTIDEHGRLYVAANGAGEVWRVDTDRRICALTRGLLLPSAVALGAGGAFPRDSLYVVTFSGKLLELPGATR